MMTHAKISYDGGSVTVPVLTGDHSDGAESLSAAFLGLPPSQVNLVFPPKKCLFQFVGSTILYECFLLGDKSTFALTKLAAGSAPNPPIA